MEEKQKKILAVVLVTIFVAILLFFIVKSLQISTPPTPAKPVSQVKIAPEVETPTNTNTQENQTPENTNVVKPIENTNSEITGKLVGFKDGSLIIDQPTGAILIPFTIDTKLSNSDGSKAELTNLKPGVTLKVTRNGSAGAASGIVITK
jgi:hypothetical protein